MMEKLNMTDVKMNYKGNYKNHNCSNEEETTTHLLKVHGDPDKTYEICVQYWSLYLH